MSELYKGVLLQTSQRDALREAIDEYQGEIPPEDTQRALDALLADVARRVREDMQPDPHAEDALVAEDRDFRLGLKQYPQNIAAIRSSDHDLDKLIELAGKAAKAGAWRNCQAFLSEANIRALVLIGGGK